jgi:hypothetical protein
MGSADHQTNLARNASLPNPFDDASRGAYRTSQPRRQSPETWLGRRFAKFRRAP